MQTTNNMALTDKQKIAIRKLSIEDKVEILHEIADEFMTIEEFREVSGMPRRTIYDKFGTDAVKGIEFCGHKIVYM